MTLRFVVTLKLGVNTLARVEGPPRDASVLTVADVAEKVIALEQEMERLTGLRCHIESEQVERTFPHIDALPISEEQKARLRDEVVNPDPRD